MLGLLGITAIVCCVGGLVSTRVVPDPLATAPVGKSLRVTMGADQDFAVVVKLDAVMPQDTDAAMLKCEISGPGSHRVSWTRWEWLLASGDGEWRIDHQVRVPGVTTATYEVTCKANDPHVTEFGIAKAPNMETSVPGVVAMICCPGIPAPRRRDPHLGRPHQTRPRPPPRNPH